MANAQFPITGYKLRESDKHFFLALTAVTGAVFFWRGLWELINAIPVLNEPLMSVAVGLLIMTLTGVIYREGVSEEESTTEIADIIHAVFKKADLHRKTTIIHYRDNVTGKLHTIAHAELRGVEHNYLILEKGKKEFFVPLQRVELIKQNGAMLWKKGLIG